MHDWNFIFSDNFLPKIGFRDPKAPRLLLTLGIAGSGKSFLAQYLNEDWVIINSDQLRFEKDPLRMFTDEMRIWVLQQIQELFQKALHQKKSIFLDMTSLTLQRVPFMWQAHQAGYFVQGVVFKSPNLKMNLEKVKKRVQQGGIDLVRDTSGLSEVELDQRRFAIIQSLDRNMKVFCSDLKEDLHYRSGRSSIFTDAVDFQKMKKAESTFEDYLQSLSDPEKEQVLSLQQEDVFHHLVRWNS